MQNMQAQTIPRIHYMDNLRAIAMLLGIYIHAVPMYGFQAQEFWFIKDIGQSYVMEYSLWWLHLFRMSLFFLVAGFFGHYLINKRGTVGFVKNRLLRLAVPFALFWPLVIASIIIILALATNHISDMPQLLEQAGQDDQQNQNSDIIKTFYLWFLYYLLLFVFSAAILRRVRLPVLENYWQSFFSQGWHLLYLPLLIAPSLYLAGHIPHPAPESFIPTAWAFMFYGLFYLIGWQLYRQQGYIEQLACYIWPMGIFCVFGSIAFFIFLPAPSTSGNINLAMLPMVILQSYLAVYLVLISLFLGKRLLNISHQYFRYIADASYWMYLVHLPILLFIQIYMAELNWNVWLKLSIALLWTSIVTLASYELLVRYSWLGSLLNGKRQRSGRFKDWYLKQLLLPLLALALCLGVLLALIPEKPIGDDEHLIKDQFDQVYSAERLNGHVALLFVFEDNNGKYCSRWGEALYHASTTRADLADIRTGSIMNLQQAPRFFKGLIILGLPKNPENWVALDWQGTLAQQYDYQPGACNINLLSADGEVVAQFLQTELKTDIVDEIVQQLQALVRKP